MKKLLLLIYISLCVFAQAQTTKLISEEEYQHLKAERKLEKDVFYTFPQTEQTVLKQNPGNINQIDTVGTQQCSCIVPLDSSFTLVTFNGDSTVDDGQSALINLPFSFPFYYNQVNSIYINTNGYVTAVAGNGAFNNAGIPNTVDQRIIAPFLSNVDLTGAQGGKIYYKVSPHNIIVKWEKVGYFPQQSDKVNTFQLIIQDPIDTILPLAKNIAFCYGDMQWTTGSASGFGGIGASIGMNEGNGTGHAILSRCDTTGTFYDGPGGNPDGVDWLDHRSFYFNFNPNSIVEAIDHATICGVVIPIDTTPTKLYCFFINFIRD